ncbi:MAG TPA: hypothetical protein VHY22_06755, partial [Chthoniobacteraceae bacterium]|nr:hypothetical protein [Chthoniobacteraceae bacterium]
MARFAGDKAAALIIVLAIIVLIAAVVIGFLFRAGTSRITTSSYSAKVSTRRLADMVVNLVQGQINDATGQGSSAAWASQPGAVRVFDDTGALLNIYRLYSSTSMTTATPGDLANDVPVSGTWESAPATWVDLNAPIAVQGVDSTGTNPVLTYPILDPRDPTNPGTAANPGELSVTKMPGFFLGTSNGTGTVPGTTAVPTAGGANANIIPMPVRWMYVLQDGSIVAPTVGKSGGNSVTIASASGTNPIVGRVAFWTDDDSCKVNINTAAGSLSYRPDPTQNYKASSVLPAPWDTPRFANWDEFRLFAQDQPVHNEYQRYPGHPATTVLYNILNGLGMPFLDGTPQYPPDGSASYLQSGFMAAPNGSGTTSFFGLLPRYSDAWSSNGGLAATILSGTAAPPVTLTGTVPSRLYTSLGEFIYGTATTTGSNGTIQRAKNMILSGFDVTR